MALTTKSGALWQMSRAEKDEGWTDEGHAFVGREVVRSTSATAQSVGTIYCWLPPTVEDATRTRTASPRRCSRCGFWWASWTATSKIWTSARSPSRSSPRAALRPPEPPKPKPKPKPKKSPVPSDDEDEYDDAAAPRSAEDEEASDYEEEARKPAAKKRKAASPPKPAKKAPAKRKSPAKPAAPPAAPRPRRRSSPSPRRRRGRRRPQPSGRPGAERATARYAWEPLRDNQLALAAGDNLEVWPTNESWWFARNARTGAEGRVSGHVKVGPGTRTRTRTRTRRRRPCRRPAPPPAPKVKAEPTPAPAPAPKKKKCI